MRYRQEQLARDSSPKSAGAPKVAAQMSLTVLAFIALAMVALADSPRSHADSGEGDAPPIDMEEITADGDLPISIDDPNDLLPVFLDDERGGDLSALLTSKKTGEDEPSLDGKKADEDDLPLPLDWEKRGDTVSDGEVDLSPDILSEKPKPKYPTLMSSLDRLVVDVETGVLSAADAVKQTPMRDESDSGVAVTVYASEDISAAKRFLADRGVEIRNVGKTYLEAYVPMNLLGEVSEQPGVIRVQTIVGPQIDQTTPDPCITDLGSLSAPVSLAGSWSSECESEIREDRYSRYYTFTLAQNSLLSIDLASPTVDTYLRLMSGAGKSGGLIAFNDDGGEGSNSRIRRRLAPGAYTIEATTISAMTEGSFTIEISIPQVCSPSPLGEVLVSASSSSEWVNRCESANLFGHRARHYSFTLAQDSFVTIQLESPDVDTRMYLISGASSTGDVIAGTGVVGGSIPTSTSYLEQTLPSGAYTIEATTFQAGYAGNFTLTVSATPATNVPTTSCDRDLSLLSMTVTLASGWDGSCDETRHFVAGKPTRHYYFALTEERHITIDLTSLDADTYMYLLQYSPDDGWYNIIARDDNGGTGTNSRIRRVLPPGSYWIAATTNRGRGRFALRIAASSPLNVCQETLGAVSGTETVTGSFAAGCDALHRPGAYGRYYTFTLAQDSTIAIDLTSSNADTFMYLLSGASSDWGHTCTERRRRRRHELAHKRHCRCRKLHGGCHDRRTRRRGQLHLDDKRRANRSASKHLRGVHRADSRQGDPLRQLWRGVRLHEPPRQIRSLLQLLAHRRLARDDRPDVFRRGHVPVSAARLRGVRRAAHRERRRRAGIQLAHTNHAGGRRLHGRSHDLPRRGRGRLHARHSRI